MSFLKAAIKLLTFLLFISHLYSVDTVQLSKVSHTYLGKKVIFSDHSIEKGILVFAACNEEKYEKNCTIIQQNYPYYETIHSCNLTINAENKFLYDLELGYIDVSPLDENNTLLIYKTDERGSNRSYDTVSTLRMSDCRTTPIEIPGSQDILYPRLYWQNTIVKYNRHYDIFTESPNSFGNKISQIRVNSRTGLTRQLNSHLKDVSLLETIIPVVSGSPAKSYFYKDRNVVNGSRYWLMKSEGSAKLLTGYKQVAVAMHSVVNKAIGVCIRPWEFEASKIQCIQYDKNGNVQSSENIHLPIKIFEEEPQFISMHMCARGGFLMMVAKSKNYIKNSGETWNGYHAIRVDGKGKFVGSLPLKEFDDLNTRGNRVKIYDNGDGLYCATLIGWDRTLPGDERRSHIIVNEYCFFEDDFKI